MDSLELNKNIYGINPHYPVFGSFTNNRPVTSPVKTPEIRDSFTKTKADPTSDGRFSFLEFGKNMVKGFGQFFTDIYKVIVENPLFALPAIALVGAMAFTPVGLAFLAGGGVFAALFGTLFVGVKAAINIANGEWDELEKQGKDVGKIIPGAILSTIGAVSAVKQLQTLAGVSGKVGTGKSVLKAGDINAFFITMLKDTFKAPFRLFKKYVRGKEYKNGVFLGAMKADWKTFTNGPLKSKEGNFFKRIIDFFLNPRLDNRLFPKDGQEALFLSRAVDKDRIFTHKGLFDFTYGLGRQNWGKNSLNSSVTALRTAAGE